jgi:Type I phosphodiesterase / nucleotide pyrophosphatase
VVTSRTSRRLTFLAVALVGAAAIVVAWARGIVLALAIGAVALLVVLAMAWVASRRHDAEADRGRRGFLLAAGLLGATWVVAGAAAGRLLRRTLTTDSRPAMDAMARGLGSEYMELLIRTFRPGRSGELQLLLAPYNSSNYANESRSLVPDDPRTSHASVWMYLERVPLAVHAPGLVAPGERDERVSLADIAPTIAHLIGYDDFLSLGREGRPLPGVQRPSTPPKAVVVFVIDGGGWNVLHHWSSAWPNLRRLFGQSLLYRNAVHGSFPAVTAVAHATIGTGTFPREHGITGHNIRVGSGVRKTYGTPGRAQPGDILIPTLADLWHDANPGHSWVGEIGYQVWHLGMLGRGTRRAGDYRPVAVFWDEFRTLGSQEQWQPHNPTVYRLPAEVPGLDVYQQHLTDYAPMRPPPDEFDPQGRQTPCCEPPIVQYEGDLIEATIRSEEFGRHDATDLLFINYKAPDYTGHIYNFLDDHERIVLEEVDRQLARLVETLDSTFAPGEYALIVTADHGQCPLPDAVNGARLDPVQLEAAIQGAFGRSVFGVVDYVAPSEVFLDSKALLDAGVSPDQIAAFLRDYRYGQNIGPYVPNDAVEHDLLRKLEFSGVFGGDYLASLTGHDVARFGTTTYGDADPLGIPDYRAWT